MSMTQNEINVSLFDEVKKLQIENERLREALDRIARPLWWMQEDQKRKTGSINGVSGAMAIALSESHEYLKCIAREALK
jgi:regulator of replication initiation timing